MALTTLGITSNRFLSAVMLYGASAAVAVDAGSSERFELPAGFGDLALHAVMAQVGSLSGAYAAQVPPYEGVKWTIGDSAATTNVDFLGSVRMVDVGTQSTRPVFCVGIELFRPTILRQREQLTISMPIIGAGAVTATVECFVRGVRLKNS